MLRNMLIAWILWLSCMFSPTQASVFEVAGVHMKKTSDAITLNDSEGILVGWKTPTVAKAIAAEKLAKNFVQHQKHIQEVAIALATHLPDVQAAGISFGPDDDADEVRRRIEGISDDRKQWLRSMIQLAGILGIGIRDYYFNISTNIKDWKSDFDLTERFTTLNQVYIDDNPFLTNAQGHFMAGVGYYVAGRSAGFDPGTTILLSAAAATLWEWVGEYREVIALNDLILTPIAGSALGEALHQLSSAIAQNSSEWIRIGLSPLANPFTGVNFTQDPAKKQYFSTFTIRYDRIRQAANQIKNLNRLSLELETGRLDSSAPSTEIKFAITDPNTRIQDIEFYSRMVLAAYQSSKVQLENGELKSLLVFRTQLHNFYDLKLIRTPSQAQDNMAVVGVLGTRLEVAWFTPSEMIRFGIDLTPNYAMIRPVAIEKYRALHGDEGITSTLKSYSDGTPRAEPYFHAYAARVRAFFEANYGRLEFLASYQNDSFWQFTGLEHHETPTVLGTERRQEIKASVSIQIIPDWLTAGLEWQRRIGSGTLGQVFDRWSVDQLRLNVKTTLPTIQ